jgi:hypothetical protein
MALSLPYPFKKINSFIEPKNSSPCSQYITYGPSRSQFNLFHISTPYYYNTRLNIILQSTYRPQNWHFRSGFSVNIFISFWDVNVGRNHAVRRRFPILNAHMNSQSCPCSINGEQNGIGVGFSLNTFVLICQLQMLNTLPSLSLECTLSPTYDIIALCPLETSRLTGHLAVVQQIDY